MDPYIYLCEIFALSDYSGGYVALNYATAGYQTKASDFPANTYYDARLMQPGLLRLAIPSGFEGVAEASFGEIVLNNADGALSHLPYYGLDGQTATIYRIRRDQSYSTRELVMTVVMEQAIADRSTVRIRLRGMDAILRRPYLQQYLGTGGTEGGAELAGNCKPRVYGTCFNVTPVCIDTTRYIYQVSDDYAGGAAYNVRVGGVAISTYGAAYANFSDMQTTAPAAGQARLYAPGGCFRLGSAPTGQVTCDVDSKQAAGLNSRPVSLWPMLYAVMYDACSVLGLSASSLSWQTWSYAWTRPANWPVAGSWPSSHPNVGAYCTDATLTAADVLAQLCSGTGVWCGFNLWDGNLLGGGTLKFGAEVFPAVINYGRQTDLMWNESHILSVTAIADPGVGRGVPSWRTDISFRRNWTVMNAAQANGLTPATLGILGQISRRVQASAPTVTGKFSTAQTYTAESSFNDDNTGVGYEATRQLELRRYVKTWYSVRIALQAVFDRDPSCRPYLGSPIYLSWPGLLVEQVGGGLLGAGWFHVMALQLDLAAGELQLTVRQATEQTL